MSNDTILKRMLLGTVAYGAIASIAVPISASAQDGQAADDGLRIEEITVTARKKQELIVEVPMNISAVGAAEISKRNLINKEDIFRTIAGASTPGVGGTNGRGQLILRGLSGSNSASPGTSSTFTDGIPLDFSDLYDVERVEVLRGPQGTLYGSNAIGGTVRVITNKPDLSEFGVGGAVNFKSEKNRRGIETRGYGMINIPLVEDELALRITGASGSKDGKIVNVFNDHRGVETERFLRGQMLWAPSENTRVNLSFVQKNFYDDTYASVDVSTPDYFYEAVLTPNAAATYGYDVAVNYPDCPTTTNSRPECLSGGNIKGDINPEFAVWNLTDDYTTNKTDIFGLNIEQDDIIDGVDLTYSGSYREYTTSGRQGGWSRLDAGDMFETWILDKDGYDRWTHELRLQSNTESALEWTIGAFYDETDWTPSDSVQWQYHASDNRSRAIAEYWWGEDPTQLGIDLYGDGTKNYNVNQIKYNQKEFAFFGEASYTFDLGDGGALEITGGIRFYDLDDDISVTESGIWVGPTPVNTITQDGETGNRKKASISYRPNDDLAIFAVYSEGYRPGGNNGNSAPNACAADVNIGSYVDRYKSDQIKNYEVGVKGFAFDRRFQFSSAVYQIDWTGVQASVYMPSCGFSYVANAASARSKGVEFESTSLLARNTKLIVNAAYTNSKMTSDVPSLSAMAGDDMTMVPEYNFYVALDQGFTIADRDASIRIDVSAYGEYKSHFNVKDEDVSAAYKIVNLSGGFDITENARFSLHVNNLLNKKYTNYKRSRYRGDYSVGALNEYYGEERSVSARLDFTF